MAEEEEEDKEDEPEVQKEIRFQQDPNISEDQVAKRTTKVRTTGYIYADQLQKILDEAGELLSELDEDDNGVDENVPKTKKAAKVQFDVSPGDGVQRKLVK